MTLNLNYADYEFVKTVGIKADKIFFQDACNIFIAFNQEFG